MPMHGYGGMGMMNFGIYSIIMFIIWLAFLGISLYIMILVIKALKIYIKKNS